MTQVIMSGLTLYKPSHLNLLPWQSGLDLSSQAAPVENFDHSSITQRLKKKILDQSGKLPPFLQLFISKGRKVTVQGLAPVQDTTSSSLVKC